MKSLIAATGSLALLASILQPMDDAVAQDKKSQTVTRAGSLPSTKGPAEYFTGNARVDSLAGNSGSTRALPVKYSAGPFVEGSEPARVTVCDFLSCATASSMGCNIEASRASDPVAAMSDFIFPI